ncbi:A24 family peptidase [Tuwongella immobilis]|uniref:A24 family peptidase n=1 Tax=Tuwongella immobilis TaxID=692036 RepID=UPI0013A6CDCD|nr:A24 family peptidase [Tuwongella immobilis]
MFFPNEWFAVLFGILLLGPLVAAAVIDMRTFRIPKWISVGLLALGLVVTLMRGAWLGSLGGMVWTLEPGGWLTGLGDAFLFAIAGFFTGFLIFFGIWLIGVAGGGDAKLAGALGVWLGPYGFLVAMTGAFLVVLVTAIGKTVGKIFSGKMSETVSRPSNVPLKQRGQRLSFSLPLAVGTFLALFGLAAEDFKRWFPPPESPQGMVSPKE